MRGLTILLCLALPGAIVGSILKHHNAVKVAEKVVGTPLHYIGKIHSHVVPDYLKFAAKKNILEPKLHSVESRIFDSHSEEDQRRPREELSQLYDRLQSIHSQEKKHETSRLRHTIPYYRNSQYIHQDSNESQDRHHHSVRISPYRERYHRSAESQESHQEPSQSHESHQQSSQSYESRQQSSQSQESHHHSSQSQEHQPFSESRESRQESSQSQEKQSYKKLRLPESLQATRRFQRHQPNEIKEESKESDESVHKYKEYADPSEQNQFLNLKSKFEDFEKHANPISWKGLVFAAGSDGLVEDESDIEHLFDDAYKSMKRLNNQEKAKFHSSYLTAMGNDNPNAHLNVTDILKQNDYHVEEHVVKTDDGYYLTMYRIPSSSHSKVSKPEVVFLMHGLLGCADDWLVLGPGKSLPFLLSDAGYDVYMGNARGSKYSQRHASKNPAQNDFWKFSQDEIALHDLPAMIDKALEISKKDKLFYIGHSQGTTNFFSLASSRPQYNDKIKTMFALAPVALMGNNRSPFFKMISPDSDTFDRMTERLGSGEFKPKPEILHYVGGSLCEKAIGCKEVCSDAQFAITGIDADQLDMTTVPNIIGHSPNGGSSMRVMKQLGQAVASHDFRKYDFGPQINQQVYGQHLPPSYQLQSVTAPVVLYYSDKDWLAHPKDVKNLQQRLPNVSESNKVQDDFFSHMDFVFSKNAPEYIYKKLMNTMQNINSQ